MDLSLITMFDISLVIIILILIVLVFFLITRPNKKDETSLKMLQNQIFHLNQTIDRNLSKSNDNIWKTLETNQKISSEATKKIEEITKKLSSLEQTNNEIKNIWKQLKWLENILQNPKQRGILWEYFLEQVLKNVLSPSNYVLQYNFKSGDIVDAVVLVWDNIIPIDSKFSLENYNKIASANDKETKEIYEKQFKSDLKKRIDETSKYIKPEEGTLDFAFMFIPSETIYYDLLTNKSGSSDLLEYAFKERKVIIVSPTSFYAYLQTVLQWLKALVIEQKAKDIAKQVSKLARHLETYEQTFEKLGNSLGTTVNHYNNSYKEFRKIDKDIVKITWEKTNLEKEPILIDKPE